MGLEKPWISFINIQFFYYGVFYFLIFFSRICKISYPWLITSIDYNILKIKVSMYNILFVYILNTFYNREEKLKGVILILNKLWIVHLLLKRVVFVKFLNLKKVLPMKNMSNYFNDKVILRLVQFDHFIIIVEYFFVIIISYGYHF